MCVSKLVPPGFYDFHQLPETKPEIRPCAHWLTEPKPTTTTTVVHKTYLQLPSQAHMRLRERERDRQRVWFSIFPFNVTHNPRAQTHPAFLFSHVNVFIPPSSKFPLTQRVGPRWWVVFIVIATDIGAEPVAGCRQNWSSWSNYNSISEAPASNAVRCGSTFTTGTVTFFVSCHFMTKYQQLCSVPQAAVVVVSMFWISALLLGWLVDSIGDTKLQSNGSVHNWMRFFSGLARCRWKWCGARRRTG